ncbi:hypothetical protein OAE72_00990 [Akkermansiaceae bacterium]|nr:hypothetical protein [Akkermansiaceae bacterium]
MKILAATLLVMSLASGETPDEACVKLTKAYSEGEGHILVYQLSKKGVPKGPTIKMNVAKGRKHSAFSMKAPDGAPMLGLAHYPTGKGEKGSTLMSKAGVSIEFSLGEDMQALLNHLRGKEGRKFYFNPQCSLTPEMIDIGAGYTSGDEKPFPWKSLIEEDIERVERKEDSVTLHGKDGVRMKFQSATGLLLEQSFPGPDERRMKLVSREKLDAFEAKKHGLSAQPGMNDALVKMAQASFNGGHKIMTMIAAGWLLQLPEEQQAEKLADFQTKLNDYYRKIGQEHPYLTDPMKMKAELRATISTPLDRFMKAAREAGKDPLPILKRERAKLIETAIRKAEQLAAMMTKKSVFELDPKAVHPDERPALEKVILAQKVAILRNLARAVAEEEIDKRIGEN